MKDFFDDYLGEGSSFQTSLTLLRYPLGISLFFLPWVMNIGGIIAGPIIIAVFVIFNAYRSHVLSNIVTELTSNGISFPTGCSDWWILENSLGKVKRTSVNCYLVLFSTLQWLALLGHASTFLAFAGLSLNQDFPVTDWPGIVGDRSYIGICTGVVIFVHAVTQWLRNTMQKSCDECICPNLCSGFMLILLPALFAVFIGVPAITVFTATLADEQVVLQPSIEVDWMNIGLLLAGVSFVIGATPDDVSSSYGTIRNRGNFPLVVLIVAAITILIGVGFSIAAFLGLDSRICESITFNLTLTEGIHFTVRFLSSICALIFVSFRHQIEPRLSNRLSTAEIICDVVFKMIFLGTAGSLAVGLPTFSGLACLFGSLTSFSLTLTFPFLCDLLLHVTGGRTPSNEEEVVDEGTSLTGAPMPETPKSVMRIIRDVIFIVLGVAGTVGGAYSTAMYLAANVNKSALQGCAPAGTNATTLF